MRRFRFREWIWRHCGLSDLSQQLTRVELKLVAQKEILMGLQESFDGLSTEIDTIITELAALKAQIAAGSPVTAEQIDALTAKLKAAE